MESEPIPSSVEIEREYRVLRQTLHMHASLRERYARLALLVQLSLLVCSVLFCATTFASDDLYRGLGMDPQYGKLVRGLASVGAFALSVCMLVVDFKGMAALHGAAADRWARTSQSFRRHQPDRGCDWPEAHRSELHVEYGTADKESVKIPNGQFARLKGRYLRSVEMGKLIDCYPATPRVLLLMALRLRDSWKFFRDLASGKGLNAPTDGKSKPDSR